MKNIGAFDKVIRYMIAVVIAVLGFAYQSWWGLLAVIPFTTALFNWCPLYYLAGIKTCPAKS